MYFPYSLSRPSLPPSRALSVSAPVTAGFLEADLGFWANNGFYVTGVYDFIFANAGIVNFYVGPGVQLGFYNHNDNSGFNAGLAGQLGMEFEIPSAPVNISLDWRPVYYFNYGGFGWQGQRPLPVG